MPTKVLPDATAFRAFTAYMKRLGFRAIRRTEFRGDIERLGLQAPRPREGRETGFSYWANGLAVVAWTTFLEADGRARDEDAGWVLIKEGDAPRYFSHPLRRTRGFLRRLFKYARACRNRVLNRPLCPICKNHMRIEYGKAIGQRFWACFKRKFHKEPKFVSWDYGLTKQDKDFFKGERRSRRRYYEQRREEGKPLHVARLMRAQWKITRPENVMPAR